MKSSKQRRAEIKAERRIRAAKRAARAAFDPRPFVPIGQAVCERALLAPDNSYGVPEFVRRGYYVDVAFHCVDCGAEGVWTALRQKWWYEVAKGGVWTTARRCRACRAKKRAGREAARAASQAGQLRKLARLAQ